MACTCRADQVGALPVGYDRASDFGLMKIDNDGRWVRGATKWLSLACKLVFRVLSHCCAEGIELALASMLGGGTCCIFYVCMGRQNEL